MYHVSFLIGDTLRLGAPLLTTCRHSRAQLIKAGAFYKFVPYGPIYFVARDLNLLDVHKPYASSLRPGALRI